MNDLKQKISTCRRLVDREAGPLEPARLGQNRELQALGLDREVDQLAEGHVLSANTGAREMPIKKLAASSQRLLMPCMT